MSNGSDLLSVEELVVRYGAIEAVRGASLSVRQGEIVTLLGANGAGKSSILNAIMGLVPVAGGRVVLEGSNVAGEAPEKIAGAVFLKANQHTGRFLVRPETGLGEGLLITGHNPGNPAAEDTWGPLPLDFFGP